MSFLAYRKKPLPENIGFSVWGMYFPLSCMCNDSKERNITRLDIPDKSETQTHFASLF